MPHPDSKGGVVRQTPDLTKEDDGKIYVPIRSWQKEEEAWKR